MPRFTRPAALRMHLIALLSGLTTLLPRSRTDLHGDGSTPVPLPPRAITLSRGQYQISARTPRSVSPPPRGTLSVLSRAAKAQAQASIRSSLRMPVRWRCSSHRPISLIPLFSRSLVRSSRPFCVFLLSRTRPAMRQKIISGCASNNRGGTGTSFNSRNLSRMQNSCMDMPRPTPSSLQ